MATPNYSFEKRRRELDKKAKKEEKRKQKLEASAASKDGVGEVESPSGDESASPEESPG